MVHMFNGLRYTAATSKEVQDWRPVAPAAKAASTESAAFCFGARFMAAHSGSRKTRRFRSAGARYANLIGLPPRLASWVAVVKTAPTEANMAEASLRALAPTLVVIDGTPTTSSIDVARHFGKRHDNVMQAIKALREQVGPDHALNFQEMLNEVQIGSGATRQDPAYRLTRDGFTLLAMGFTGKKALAFKLAYIDAFNRMEAQLRGQASSAAYSVAPHQSLSAEEADMLRGLITGHAATLPKPQQAEFTIKAWSKLKARFGCAYRDIPREQFTDAISLLGRHLVAYSTPAALPQATQPHFSRACHLPEAQLHAITTPLQRLTSMFHPFSDQFADCIGILRALRGLDPRLGTQQPDFITLISRVN